MCRINVLKWLNPNPVVIMGSRMPITNLLWHIMGYIQLNLHPSPKHLWSSPAPFNQMMLKFKPKLFSFLSPHLDYPGYFPTHAVLHETIKFSTFWLLRKTVEVCFTPILKFFHDFRQTERTCKDFLVSMILKRWFTSEMFGNPIQDMNIELQAPLVLMASSTHKVM